MLETKNIVFFFLCSYGLALACNCGTYMTFYFFVSYVKRGCSMHLFMLHVLSSVHFLFLMVPWVCDCVTPWSSELLLFVIS